MAKPRSSSSSVSFTLKRFPQGVFSDIYGDPTKLINRMLWVNSQVYHVIDMIKQSSFHGDIVISDSYRKPTESYLARKKKGPSVAPCGLSGHNYGISIDIAVEETLRKMSCSYPQMITEFQRMGLFGIKSENWHFNLMFSDASQYFYSLHSRMSPELITHINSVMVKQFSKIILPVQSVSEIQKILGLTVDGVVGRNTILSVSMILAEHLKMLPVDTATKEIVVNFDDIWSV